MTTTHDLFADGYFPSSNIITSNINSLPTPPASNESSYPPTPSETSIVGRKRGRSEFDSTEDERLDGSLVLEQKSAILPNQNEIIYGPGRTIGYPNDPSGHFVIPDKSAIDEAARPVTSTRKSQRLDLSTLLPQSPSLSSPNDCFSRTPTLAPHIDQASLLLGVSWSRMDATDSTQISQRAYCRWIDRHYPNLTNIEVWFENSAIPGYLGKATCTDNNTTSFYLWSYDLHQAIFITENASDLVIKLSQPHMSVSQATEKLYADVQSVVEASAANAAIVRNDPFVSDQNSTGAAGMDLD